MKKFLSILLAIILTFSLFACSNNENKNSENSSTNVEQNNKNNNTDEPNNEVKNIEWELKDLSIDVPEVKVETYTVEGVDETFEVGITVYNFTGEEIIKTLKSNNFISKNYVVEDVPSWEEYGFLSDYDTNNGKAYNIHYNIGEYVSANNADSRVFVYVGRNTYELKNSDGFYLSFNGLDINKQTQKDTLSVLSDFIDEDMANYLVYAKDNDGKKNDDDLDNEYELYEEIESGVFIYTLKREVVDNGEYQSDITYSIDVKVNDYQLNYLMASNHDYSSKHSDFKYKPNVLFPTLGSVDPNNHTDIFKEYYLIGADDTYQSSSVDGISIDYNYSLSNQDVCETYIYSIDSDKTSTNSYFYDETMNLRYTCEDVNGKLQDLRIDVSGDIEFDELNENDVVEFTKDIVKKKLLHILPNLDVDLSSVKYGEKVEIVGKYQHDAVAGEWEYKLTIDLTCEYDDEICFDFEWNSSNALM